MPHYIADPRLRAAAEKYGVEAVLECRTLYQLARLRGLVPGAVAERAEALMRERCPQEVLKAAAAELGI